MPALAVAFDLDDTLVDHDRAARAAISAWLAAYGIGAPVAPSATTDAWIALEKRHFGDYAAGRVDFAEHRRRRLRGLLEVVGESALGASPDDALDAMFDEYREIYTANWTLYDDVVPAMTRIAQLGIPVAVLTNGQAGQQNEKVQRTGLAPYVGILLTVSDVPAPKPDARAFATLCSRLGLAPDRVLFVGDDLRVDVEGADAAGLSAVHLDRRGAAPRGSRHRTISTLADLEVP